MTGQPTFNQRFFNPVRKFAASILLAISLIATAPRNAHADPGKIDDADHYDGRVQGFDPDVELPAGSNGMTWVLVVVLGGICVSVIFKDAKRSHLD